MQWVKAQALAHVPSGKFRKRGGDGRKGPGEGDLSGEGAVLWDEVLV